MITKVLIISYMIATCYFAFDPSVFGIGVLILNLLPSFALYKFISRETINRKFALILTVLFVAQGSYSYVSFIYIHPDPQSAIMFFFLPIYLLLELCSVYVLHRFFRFLLKGKRTK